MAPTQPRFVNSRLLLGVALSPADIGKRIQEAREARHWTQMQFAQEANVSMSSVSRWERGQLPPVRELIRLADVLGVEPEYLVEPPTASDDDRLLAAAIAEAVPLMRQLLRRLGEEPPASTRGTASTG